MEPKRPLEEPVFTPKAADLGSLIHWLHNRTDISAARLATLFGTTAGNIRVIASRSGVGSNNQQAPQFPFVEAPTESEAATLGIRFRAHATQRMAAFDVLKHRLDQIVATNRDQYQFWQGAREVRRLLPFVGHPGNAAWIGLAAEMRHQLAWFYCHLGMSRTALLESRRASDLFRAAFHESRQRRFAAGFIQAALPASNAALLHRTPQLAYSILAVAREAAESNNIALGSDHHRQCGVALFQLAEDQQARLEFELAARAVHDLSEAETPITSEMASTRHISVLGTPNFDASAQLRHSSEKWFGKDSLQYSMSTNWAAATALLIGDRQFEHQAMEMLDGNSARAGRFGHQATITHLLRITPELGLYPKLRTSYIRRALYENTLKDR